MIRYKKEFKQSLVEMHNQGRSYTDLSAEYGPSVDSTRNWVKLYAVHEVDGEKWTQADVNALQKGKRQTSRRTWDFKNKEF